MLPHKSNSCPCRGKLLKPLQVRQCDQAICAVLFMYYVFVTLSCGCCVNEVLILFCAHIFPRANLLALALEWRAPCNWLTAPVSHCLEHRALWHAASVCNLNSSKNLNWSSRDSSLFWVTSTPITRRPLSLQGGYNSSSLHISSPFEYAQLRWELHAVRSIRLLGTLKKLPD